MNNFDWKPLSLDPKSLAPAINMIHRGVQFISMVGKYYVENQADDSHTNMEWLSEHEVLAGNWANSPKGKFRFAMRPKDLRLIMFDEEMSEIDHYPLHGQVLSQILDWVKVRLHQLEVDGEQLKLDLHYDIPHHPTDDGAPFEYNDPELFAEMANHRANSDIILKAFAAQDKTASPVRTWPHHFDNGAYIPMVFDDQGNAIKSYSIGFAIHDEAIDEPYYYITTWSATGDNFYEKLTPLPFGEWLTTPFNGAILRASEFVNQPTPHDQARVLCGFLVAGIAASKKIIGV